MKKSVFLLLSGIFLLSSCGNTVKEETPSETGISATTVTETTESVETAESKSDASEEPDTQTTSPAANIEETTIVDDENVCIVSKLIDYSFAYPQMSLSITNKSDYTLYITPYINVNDYISSYGNSLYHTYYLLKPGEEKTESLNIFFDSEDDTDGPNWYSAINNPNEIDKIEIQFAIRSEEQENKGQVNIDFTSYPAVNYCTDPVLISTDSEEDSTIDPSGIEIANNDGIKVQFVTLATQNNNCGIIFFIDNSSDSNYLISSTESYVGDTLIPYNDNMYSGADYGLLYDAFGGKTPIFLNYYPAHKKGYIVLPVNADSVVNADTAQINFIFSPIKENLYEYNAIEWDGRMSNEKKEIIDEIKNGVTVKSSFDLSSSQSTESASTNNDHKRKRDASNWIDNSSDYDFNLVSEEIDGNPCNDATFFIAAMHDICGITLNKDNLTDLGGSYTYKATDDFYTTDGLTHPNDGIARHWQLTIKPKEGQSMEELQKNWDAALEENGYRQWGKKPSSFGWDGSSNQYRVSIYITYTDEQIFFAATGNY